MEPIITSIIAGIVITIVGGYSLQWLNKRAKRKEIEKQELLDKLEAQAQMIIEMKKELWKLRKTTLIFGKILDDQTAKHHPELASSLEDIATELLKESDKG